MLVHQPECVPKLVQHVVASPCECPVPREIVGIDIHGGNRGVLWLLCLLRADEKPVPDIVAVSWQPLKKFFDLLGV